MNTVSNEVRAYMAQIGHRGGLKSKRTLSRDQARDMVRAREARRAFFMFHAQCFWYLDRNMKITIKDVPEIARGLRINGGRKGFLMADKLCR